MERTNEQKITKAVYYFRNCDFTERKIAFCPVIFGVLLILLSKTASGETRRTETDEQRLMNAIFSTYDKSSRPVYDATKSVTIAFGATLIQILDMDEKNQLLVTNLWLEHNWLDERISWEPRDYRNLTAIRLPASKLWLPDIVLYNNAADFGNKHMDINALVTSDGQVVWAPPVRLISSCNVDVSYFPFDRQQCLLKFGSWMYDKSQVDIVNKSAEVDLTNYVTNGEWSVHSTKVIRNEVVYPIGEAVYPDVTVYLIINRRIVYYLVNIIMPCLWLNIMSLLTFSLPPDSGEKLTLGITVLLSYSVFMLMVAENMPPTSEYVPLIGIYLTISMATTSITVIMTILVLKVHHGGISRRSPPNWLKSFVFNWLNCIFLCRHSDNSNSDNKKKQPKSKTYSLGPIRLLDDASTSPLTWGNVRQNSVKQNGQDGRRRLRKDDSIPFNYSDWHSEESYKSSLFQYEEKKLTLLMEIKSRLDCLEGRKAELDEMKTVVREWQEIASAIDSIMLRTFFVLNVLSTIALMIIVPVVRYSIF